MKQSLLERFKLLACVLFGAFLALAISHGINRKRTKIELVGLEYFQVDASPCFVADFATTAHEGFWVTFIAADKSEIGIMFDRERVIKMSRSTLDRGKKYIYFDNDADGLPDYKKTQNLETGESTTERFKNATFVK